jgi:hypothetical protein
LRIVGLRRYQLNCALLIISILLSFCWVSSDVCLFTSPLFLTFPLVYVYHYMSVTTWCSMHWTFIVIRGVLDHSSTYSYCTIIIIPLLYLVPERKHICACILIDIINIIHIRLTYTRTNHVSFYQCQCLCQNSA